MPIADLTCTSHGETSSRNDRWTDSPARQFTADITEGDAPLDVTFTNESQSKYTITETTWNFGDGSPLSHDQNPTHTYTTNGAYTVSLTITTPQDTHTQTETFYINIGNSTPPCPC